MKISKLKIMRNLVFALTAEVYTNRIIIMYIESSVQVRAAFFNMKNTVSIKAGMLLTCNIVYITKCKRA